MREWASYHKKPRLTLIDINLMPPWWKAPEYKPIDTLPDRWALAIAAAPLRGVYYVLSVPEEPIADVDQALRLDALNQAGEIVESIVLPSTLASQLPRRPGGWPWVWKWNLAVNTAQDWAITIADASGRVSIVLGGAGGEVRAVIPTEAIACEDDSCRETGSYFNGRLDGRLELVSGRIDGDPIVLDSRYNRLLSVGGVDGVRTLSPLPMKDHEAPMYDGVGHVETLEIYWPRGAYQELLFNRVPRVYSSFMYRGPSAGWHFVETELNGAGYQNFPAPWADGRVTQTANGLYGEFGHQARTGGWPSRSAARS